MDGPEIPLPVPNFLKNGLNLRLQAELSNQFQIQVWYRFSPSFEIEPEDLSEIY